MSAEGYESPTSVDVDVTLEYITVDKYAWPTAPAPRRSRLDEQERRRRHTECQKRFLKRKRQQLDQMRAEVTMLCLQLKFVEAMREITMLRAEQDRLRTQVSMEDAAMISALTPVDEDTIIESALAEVDEAALGDQVSDVDEVFEVGRL